MTVVTDGIATIRSTEGEKVCVEYNDAEYAAIPFYYKSVDDMKRDMALMEKFVKEEESKGLVSVKLGNSSYRTLVYRDTSGLLGVGDYVVVPYGASNTEKFGVITALDASIAPNLPVKNIIARLHRTDV